MYFEPRRCRGRKLAEKHEHSVAGIGEAAPETMAEVYAIQVAAPALLGAVLLGALVHRPMLGAVVGGAVGVATLKTPVSLLLALTLQNAGLLYVPPSSAPKATGGT